MNDPLYRFSEATVLLARRVEAAFDLVLALVFVLLALWMTRSVGPNWFIIFLDIILGLSAVQLFVKACTVYSTSQSPDRPDERERYLQSRSLYIPGSRRESGRRERES